MIRLCGFSLSNYYNKVKFALLEHEIPFVEETVQAGQDDALLAHSPLGKVPFVITGHGSLCESQASRVISAASGGPYLRGDTFGIADFSGFVHLPLVGLPAARRVTADRKAYMEAAREATREAQRQTAHEATQAAQRDAPLEPMRAQQRDAPRKP